MITKKGFLRLPIACYIMILSAIVCIILLELYYGPVFLSASRPICDHCNVILISLDTLSGEHIPCYGYDKNTTPALCAFAKSHIYFTNSYAQSYFTLPSHFSIFTSLYPSTHGVLQTFADSLDASHKTLTEVLHANGYSTNYFGQTQNEYLPLDKGLGRGFDTINSVKFGADPGLPDWKPAVSLLEKNEKEGKPTFIFLHTYFVHQPYTPMTRNLHFTGASDPTVPVTPEGFLTFTPTLITYLQQYFIQHPPSALSQETAVTYRNFLAARQFASAKDYLARLTSVDCSDFCWPIYAYYYQTDDPQSNRVAYMRGLYDELAFQLDQSLAPILQSLQPFLDKNTILVITADHGEAFLEHGDLSHTTLYNEVLRVPLIWSVPHTRARRIGTPAEGIDIYPTILNLVGITRQSPLEGADLTGLIEGLPFSHGKPYIFSELYETNGTKALKQKTVINSRWKLYVTDTDAVSDPKTLELYNAVSDPKDSTNVAQKYPSVVSTLLRQYFIFSATHTITYPKLPSQQTIDEEIQKERYFHY